MDKNSYSCIQVSTMCKYKNDYLCFMRDLNILCLISHKDGTIKVLCFLPEKEKNRLIDKILCWRNYACLVPMNSDHLYLFDLMKNDLISIDIPGVQLVKYFKFFNGCIYNDNLYLVGCYYPGLIKIELLTRKVKKIDIYNEIIESLDGKMPPFTRKSIVMKDHFIYIASAKKNIVIIVDLDNDTYYYENVGRDTSKYYGIAWDGKAFWLAPFKGTAITRWIPNCSVEEIDVSKFNVSDNIFSGISCYKDKIYLFALESDYSLEYDYQTKKGKLIHTGSEFFYEELNDEIVYQSKVGIIHIINDKEKILIPNLKEIYEMVSKSDNKWDYYMKESRTFQIDSYINELCKED